MKQILEFCMAVAAARTGVKLLSWLVMSNHYHAVIYDADGCAPEFYEHFHKLAARALNVHWSRTENLWSSEEPSLVELVNEEDVIDKIAYTLANPIAAGLVRTIEEWTGSSSWTYLDGQVQAVLRPTEFFSQKKSRLPEVIGLAISQPQFSIDRNEPFEVWAETIRKATQVRIAHLHATKPQQSYLGMNAVEAFHPLTTPESERGRRTLRPALACKNEDDRIRELSGLKGFRTLYRLAYRVMRDAERKRREREKTNQPLADDALIKRAVFPHGTYRYVRLGVPIDVGLMPFATAS